MADSETLELIVETVVTTINPDGSVNCAAMGVEWGDARIVIKPYRGTRTLRNLRATGAAVVNLTDDILLFSQAALGDPHPPTPSRDERRGRGARRRVLVAGGPRRGDRRQRRARRGHHRRRRGGTGREFLGLNRARHAVLEASILASRARLLAADDIRAELSRLQPLVDKTAGPREREAMAYVTRHLRAAVGEP